MAETDWNDEIETSQDVDIEVRLWRIMPNSDIGDV